MANLIGINAANDIANAALNYYIKKGGLSQTTQDKPLLNKLREKQKTFPGGQGKVSLPVKGTFMVDDNADFLQGYTEDQLIEFHQAQNLLRAEYDWKEVAAALVITWTELKKDGISVVEGKTVQHSKATETRLTSMLQERLSDFGESWARRMNQMLWETNAGDTTLPTGVLGLLGDDPTNGSTGGIARTNEWWRHRVLVDTTKVTASAANQTLSKALRTEMVQLRRYGGRPDFAPCGSAFLEALRLEVQEKGYYTQTNFNQKSGTNISMASIVLDGVEFIYDPTLDDLSRSKFCYMLDTSKLRLYTMDGEDNRTVTPERPYNALVFLKMMTWTGCLTANQLNCHGIYEVA